MGLSAPLRLVYRKIARSVKIDQFLERRLQLKGLQERLLTEKSNSSNDSDVAPSISKEIVSGKPSVAPSSVISTKESSVIGMPKLVTPLIKPEPPGTLTGTSLLKTKLEDRKFVRPPLATPLLKAAIGGKPLPNGDVGFDPLSEDSFKLKVQVAEAQQIVKHYLCFSPLCRKESNDVKKQFKCSCYSTLCCYVNAVCTKLKSVPPLQSNVSAAGNEKCLKAQIFNNNNNAAGPVNSLVGLPVKFKSITRDSDSDVSLSATITDRTLSDRAPSSVSEVDSNHEMSTHCNNVTSDGSSNHSDVKPTPSQATSLSDSVVPLSTSLLINGVPTTGLVAQNVSSGAVNIEKTAEDDIVDIVDGSNTLVKTEADSDNSSGKEPNSTSNQDCSSGLPTQKTENDSQPRTCEVLPTSVTLAAPKCESASSDDVTKSTAPESTASGTPSSDHCEGRIDVAAADGSLVPSVNQEMASKESGLVSTVASTTIPQSKIVSPVSESTAGKVYLAKITKVTNKKKKPAKGILPVCCKYMTKSKKQSILVLPQHELRRLARRGGNREVNGFNSNAKANPFSWPYPCSRPAFKSCWRFRTQVLRSIHTAALQLRILWAAIRWDDMQTKPPPGGNNTITSETEVTTTELLKRRDVGPFGLRSEYLVRRILVPIDLPSRPRGRYEVVDFEIHTLEIE